MPVFNPRKLDANERGGFDALGAVNSFMNGASNYNELKQAIAERMMKEAKAKYAPQSEEELFRQLQNSGIIKKAEADVAPEMQRSQLQRSLLSNKILEPQANHAEEITMADLIRQQLGNKSTGLDIQGKQIDLPFRKETNMENLRNAIYGNNILESKASNAREMAQEELRRNKLSNRNDELDIQGKEAALPFKKDQIRESLEKLRTQNKIDAAKLPYIDEIIKSDIESKKVLTNIRLLNASGKSFTSLPVEEKALLLSQARAMGYSSEQASDLFLKNFKLPDLAELKGFDKNDPSSWPSAQYAPTKKIVSQLQQSNIARAAVDAVEPKINEWMAPYASTIKGYSPKAVLEGITGGNKDSQAKAAAAGFLMFDDQMQRLKSGGVNPGVKTLEHALMSSMGNYKTLPILRDPIVFKKTQEYIREGLNDINKAENEAIFNMNKIKKSAEKKTKDFSKMSDDQLSKRLAEIRGKS